MWFYARPVRNVQCIWPQRYHNNVADNFSKLTRKSGNLLTASFSCSREAITLSRSCSSDHCTFFSAPSGSSLSPKRTALNYLYCVCHHDDFDKSFGVYDFCGGPALYRHQLFCWYGLFLLHFEITLQYHHQTIVLMTKAPRWCKLFEIWT